MKTQKVQIVDSEETFDILNVEIFEITDEQEKGLHIDNAFFREMKKKFYDKKESKGYLPTIFIGHNGFRDEKESLGFMDNLRKKGNKVYVDFVNILNEYKSEFKKYPYRSMEVYEGELTGLAILGSNSPYFENAPLVFKKEEVQVQKYFWTLNINEVSPQDDSDKKTLFDKESIMDFDAKRSEVEAELSAKFTTEKEALEAQFTKELAEKSEKLEQFEKEAKATQFAKTLSDCTTTVTEYFSKNEKLSTPNDEVTKRFAQFGATLSEESRKEFFELITSIVVYDATECGAEGEGEDKEEKTLDTITEEAATEAVDNREDGEKYGQAFSRILAEKKVTYNIK